MDYEKKHKEEIIRATQLWECGDITRENLEYIFPELKENEDERKDERIREKLIDTFNFYDPVMNSPSLLGIHKKDILAWLEKQESVGEIVERCKTSWYNEGKIQGQIEGLSDEEKYQQGWHDALEKHGEQKPFDTDIIKKKAHQIAWEISKHYDPNACKEEWCEMAAIDMASWLEEQGKQMSVDKVRPKFKVGDWVVDRNGTVQQILSYKDCIYKHTNGYSSKMFEDEWRMWNVAKDAKEGDVLVDIYDDFVNPLIFILKKFEHKDFGLAKLSDYSSYCYLTMSLTQKFKEGYYHHMNNIHPATKEQRDLLFKKMHEAGYEWDANKKELKKIENKTADKEKPMFAEGDWIISNDKKSTYQVIEVKRGIYVIRDNADNHEYHIGIEECEKSGRLWNISDAKDGDVLVLNNEVFIYAHRKQLYDIAVAHCFVNSVGGFYIEGEFGYTERGNSIHPATKEQRDLLFQKIKESGFKWDANKKGLKKIEQKPAWSEEDERNLEGVIAEIEANKNDAPDYDLATYDRFLSWLKPLKERVQPQWKLSDEQMKALKSATENCAYIEYRDCLRELIGQLKKLKG